MSLLISLITVTMLCCGKGVPLEEQVIVAEAANQRASGLWAVGCVMHRRDWDLSGFSSVHRSDLHTFYQWQPDSIKRLAHDIVTVLRSGDVNGLCSEANHFENVSEWGIPSWASGGRAVWVEDVGDHRYWVIK